MSRGKSSFAKNSREQERRFENQAQRGRAVNVAPAQPVARKKVEGHR